MAVTPASFREAFPAFVDDVAYPDTQISFWAGLALKMHAADRWGDLLDLGVMLYTGHQLALERQGVLSAATGQAPGQVQGALTGATVDKVSYSRATASLNADDSHWNLTTYGVRWKQMARLMGAGPVQLGAPLGDCGDGSGGAWYGPQLGPPW